MLSGRMITLSNIAKHYAGRTLFEGATLQINRGDRIGIVGANGSGKSTLFSILLGDTEPDEGEVILQRGTVIGHLPQETAASGDETVLELATAASPEIVELREKLKAWEAGHHTGDDDDHGLHARFEELGGYRLEPKARTILHGLAFRESDHDRPLREMSGGWIMRAHLARLLVQEPDLLMLDEPTNHLDLDALRWLQQYLQSYPGSILLISHDREFLNEVISDIVEIRNRSLTRYTGNYDQYLVQRDANRQQHQAAYENQQKEIKRLQRFADRFRAKASKATQAQAKLRQIERMDVIHAPEADEAGISFRFPQPERSGHKVIRLSDVDQSYGRLQVYRGLNFEAERGERLVLVGPNGAGKSTLLKILAGVTPIDRGVREPGLRVRIGYYAQYRQEMFTGDRTVLEEALDTPGVVTEENARTVLGSFLFRGDDVFKRTSILSGGEKSRLALVKLLLDPPNLLLMDEPTTHLDMASIDALIAALKQYEGTLIFISHDVYFIRNIAGHVLHIDQGCLTRYFGNYDYYLEKSSAASAREGVTAGTTSPAPAAPARDGRTRKEQKRIEAEQRQANARERREREKKQRELEKQIEQLEARQQTLTHQLEDPATYEKPGEAVKINRELMHVVEDLEKAMAAWESVAEN